MKLFLKISERLISFFSYDNYLVIELFIILLLTGIILFANV
jgi:hypothetical protein